MRAGGCTLQQALTEEAATMVKQSVSLARRRGHAQVTPLHVASTMLSSTACLLRAACLQSHSHPLQCKALELCFNVALNRLPASTTATSPMMGHHHHPPALSNALVAAFKRAQAHQRRGSTVESQQQPLLAVKIEIEQLVISILDDPSVSRVMREAGFSSTQVKTNVEQAVSMELFSFSPSPTNPNHKPPKDDHGQHHLIDTTSQTFQVDHLQARSEDVMSVMDCLMGRKKRSIVIVGECLTTTEGVMKGLMDKVERGDVPDLLKSIQFITLPLFSFAHMTKDEVEHKVGELRCLVKSYSCVGRGVILYLGDLKWAAEYRASCGFDHDGRSYYYCPVDHVIMELGRMVCGGINDDAVLGGGRFWFMGIASYKAYMRCRVGNPSLENLWCLHPLTIPAGSLALSLSHDSYMRNIREGDEDENKEINCFNCKTMSDDNNGTHTLSLLPSWLQQYKEDKEQRKNGTHTLSLLPSWLQQYKEDKEQSKNDIHTLSLLPSWLQQYKEDKEQISNDRQNNQVQWKEHCFLTYDANPSPASTSSSDQSMEILEYHHRRKFKEFNAENLKTLCNALEKKVPWQLDIIPEIASTILQCRSGLMRKKAGGHGSNYSTTTSRHNEDTWFFFHGCDTEGKEMISRELANLVFGSNSCFVSIGLVNSSPEKSDSICHDIGKNKRSRRETTHLERFSEAIQENPHRVFFIEDMDQVDHHCQFGIKTAIQRGAVRGSNGEGREFDLEDAIVVLSCESFDSRSRASSPLTKVKYSDHFDDQEEEEEKEECEKDGGGPCVMLDLNLTAGDEDFEYDLTVDDVGLIEWVDRALFFKTRED